MIWKSIYTRAHAKICVYVCVYVNMRVYQHVYIIMRVRWYVCVYVYARVLVYVYLDVYCLHLHMKHQTIYHQVLWKGIKPKRDEEEYKAVKKLKSSLFSSLFSCRTQRVCHNFPLLQVVKMTSQCAWLNEFENCISVSTIFRITNEGSWEKIVNHLRPLCINLSWNWKPNGQL